jgi:hypothetical protein
MERPHRVFERKIARRNLLHWMASTAALSRIALPGLLTSLSAVAHAEDATGHPAEFEPTSGDLPNATQHSPTPQLPAPDGSSDAVFDIFGNFWSLDRPDADGARKLLVLPAQVRDKWVADDLSRLPVGPWHFLCTDEFGYVWVASNRRCLRMDPHTPQAGWGDFTADLESAVKKTFQATEPAGATSRLDASITAMGIAPNGAVAVAACAGTRGAIVELDRDQKTSVNSMPAPTGIDRLLCDADGDLWLRCASKSYRMAAPVDAWQRRWQLVDRLTAGDHDLSGDVLNGKFYMAGGQNAGWGYPAVPHVFRELLAFDPRTMRWSTVAQLDQPRYYNGTSFLDGRIWIIAGYTRDQAYKPVRLNSVVIINPTTGSRTAGPSLPLPLDNPLAMHVGGRIYVAGSELASTTTPTSGPQRPCLLLSIGLGETAWRREPDGPPFLIALAGTVQDGAIYLALAGNGLGRFDTLKKTWSVVPVAHAARSPQMAAYKGEIWIMGGRDIEHQDATTIYSPRNGSWRQGPNLPRPLAWGAATEVGGRLMVVGGAAGRGYNNRTFVLRERTAHAI